MVFLRIFAFIVCFAVAYVPYGHVVTPALATTTQKIAIVVNDDVISVQDLEKRMRMVIISSGLPNTQEVGQKLLPQVVDALVREQIMLQEGAKEGFEVSAQELNNGFATIAAQNKQKPETFRTMLQRAGISLDTMERQVRSQIIWGKVVQKVLRGRVNISDRDIDAELERIRAKIGTPEYLAAEIFLPVTDPKNEADIKELSRRLVNAVREQGASFYKLAQQFSKSAGAANGGDTGWLHENQLSAEVLRVLKSLKKNEVSAPIKTVKGYHIYFLRDVRILSEDTVPSPDQIEFNIGNSRLEQLQARYLEDLRRASFIDIRL